MLANAPYAEHFVGWRNPWNYAAAGITRERLLAAGFASAECWLDAGAVRARAAARVPQPRSCSARTSSSCRAELRERFMDDVIDALGEPVVIDYVRLNIDAVA